MTASVFELMTLIDGRIEKIQQPEKFELLFFVHTHCGSKKLLISASPDNCRIQLTDEKKTSPAEAPNFLMLLRKYIQNSRIVSIEQPNTDRIVVLKFFAYNELNDQTEIKLVCEIMGKHSNIILVDENNCIIDSMRRVSSSMSSARLILPKLKYEYPPTARKHDPLLATEEDFIRCISKNSRMDKSLSAEFYGLSPTVAGLLVDSIIETNGYAPDDFRSIGRKLFEYYSTLSKHNFKPCIAKLGDNEVLLPFIPAACDSVKFNTLHEAIDEFYRKRSQVESVKRRTSSLGKILDNHIQRLERKIDHFSLIIGESEKIETLRLYGELLTANLYRIPAHATCVKLENYYLTPSQMVMIELDPMLTAGQNAQKYYKDYRRAKTALETAVSQRKMACTELEYLKGVYADLSKCLSDSDFEEIKDELISQGYIKSTSSKKRVKLPKAQPHRFTSSDGIEILVGKNNTQNDKLTFKDALPEYTWLHTKGVHGSHVIIRHEGDIPKQTLLEAAKLAAYYSQARESDRVQVDFTKKKLVKRPSGAKPGMAIYTGQRTLFVTPELCLK